VGTIAQRRPHRATGRPRGRPCGVRDTLRRGEHDAYDLARESSKRLGESDPVVQRLIETLLHFQRGDPGYVGRYSGIKLQAVMAELRLHLSDAPKRVEVSGKLGLHQLVPDAEPDGT